MILNGTWCYRPWEVGEFPTGKGDSKETLAGDVEVTRKRLKSGFLDCRKAQRAPKTGRKKRIPSQEGEIHVHTFVLGPEFGIQFTYTYVNFEHHRFLIRCTCLARFLGTHLIADAKTHNRQEQNLCIPVCMAPLKQHMKTASPKHHIPRSRHYR